MPRLQQLLHFDVYHLRPGLDPRLPTPFHLEPSQPTHVRDSDFAAPIDDQLAELRYLSRDPTWRYTSLRSFSRYSSCIHPYSPLPPTSFTILTQAKNKTGVYLTDLTFLEDGIPNTTPTGSINFTKRQKTASILHDIMQHQTTPYALHPVPELQDYLVSAIQASADVQDMYERSLDLEPRQHDEEDVLGSTAGAGYVATGSHMSSVVIASMVLK